MFAAHRLVSAVLLPLLLLPLLLLLLLLLPGVAELVPGVLFIDEVHMLDIECFTYLNR
jgi:hypothetical protein